MICNVISGNKTSGSATVSHDPQQVIERDLFKQALNVRVFTMVM